MGVLAMSVFSTFRGKELEDDPEFQKRMQDPHFREMIENSTKTTLDEKLPFQQNSRSQSFYHHWYLLSS